MIRIIKQPDIKPGEMIRAQIFRYNPEVDDKLRYETYDVPFVERMRVLDVLIYIKENLDRTLAFRYSCRNKHCGTCGVMVNGLAVLACMYPAQKVMKIEPLPHFPIIRDLVIDFSRFEKHVLRLTPYLVRSRVPSGPDHLGPEDVAKLRPPSRCLECLLCTVACPVVKGMSKEFSGPTLMMRISRFSFDKRDQLSRSPLILDEGVYACTTCARCTETCPQGLNPVENLIGLRELLVEEGYVPSTLAEALEGVYKYGNPWGLSRSKRSDWAQDLKVKYVSEREKADLLYFVGCAASYDYRAQEVARAIVKNFNALGIDFSILGNEETCCGNEICSLGEKGLFEELVQKNLGLLERYGVHKIVTTSPHCFHAFKNRYGRNDFRVQHYTQYFANLIDEGKLKLSGKIEKAVTFQDPCFLGRHNNIYDEPRKIIESIPGIRFVELSRSREQSVCCEGGGGRMWHDIPGERLAEGRVREALDVGAEIIAVACPFCLLTFDDAIKTTGNEEKIQVKDIMELVEEVL